jgi:hypothetical protein
MFEWICVPECVYIFLLCKQKDMQIIQFVMISKLKLLNYAWSRRASEDNLSCHKRNGWGKLWNICEDGNLEIEKNLNARFQLCSACWSSFSFLAIFCFPKISPTSGKFQFNLFWVAKQEKKIPTSNIWFRIQEAYLLIDFFLVCNILFLHTMFDVNLPQTYLLSFILSSESKSSFWKIYSAWRRRDDRNNISRNDK